MFDMQTGTKIVKEIYTSLDLHESSHIIEW
jgi:hypothetical protein